MKRRFADGGETPALDRLASGEDKGSFDTDVYARAKRFLAEQGKAKPAASSAKPSGARLYSPEDVLQMNYKPRRTPPKDAGAGRGFVNRTAKDVAEETGMRARDSEAANSRGMRSRNAGAGRGVVNPSTDPADIPMKGTFLSPKETHDSLKQDFEFLEGKRPASKMEYRITPNAEEIKKRLRLSSNRGMYAVPEYGDQGQFLKKGGKVKGYAKGGSIDGCAQRGKTKGRYL